MIDSVNASLINCHPYHFTFVTCFTFFYVFIFSQRFVNTTFAFISLVPLVLNLHVEFEVSSSNRCRDIERVRKFQK